MFVFSSKYNATIDDKGRVVLPAAFKKELGETFDYVLYVEKDPHEQCLNVYPSSSWSEHLEFVRSRLNMNDKMHSRLLDVFYQNFVKVGVASNMRLNLPNAFLEKMEMEKEVVFTGQGSRIRLWSAEAYKDSVISEDEFGNLYQQLMGGGL